MLLEKLVEYYSRLDPTPTMYQNTPVKWLIDLDRKGRFLGIDSTTGRAERRSDRGKEYLIPHLQVERASGIKAKLLAENGEYVFGIPKKSRTEKQKKKVPLRHNAFLEQVKECADATHEPAVEAVFRFLRNLDVEKLPLPDDFDAGMNLTFRVEGEMPVDLPAVRNFWAQKASRASGAMQCLICGEERPPAKRLAYKFKRKHIPNGQQSGMALISANLPAFESYGRKASLISPTCQECGEKSHKAAFELIEDERTSLTIGPLRYIFWTREKEDFSFATLLTKPEPGEVKLLLESAFTGKRRAAQIDPNPFYAVAFGASGGRVSVRDWLDSTVGKAKDNLAKYFLLQNIVERNGQEGHPLGLFPLAASTVQDATRGLPPNIPQSLLHVALKGGVLPTGLLAQAIKRNHAEQDVTRPRAALIKMVLLSKQPQTKEVDAMTCIEASNTNPGYLCGRLLAVLESLQYEAQGKTGTTVVSRFYGAASSAPATVFGPLLRGAQNHLDKLRKSNEGAYHALQLRLGEVQCELRAFPKTLTLEDQGLFALGYYHQRAADRAAAIAHKEAREKESQSPKTAKKP